MSIFDFFEYDFLKRALIASLILGFIGPIIGTIIVSKKIPKVSHLYGNASVSGVMFSVYLKNVHYLLVSPFFMGALFSMIAGVLLEVLRKLFDYSIHNTLVYLYSFTGALSILFAQLSNGVGTELFTYLYGNILFIGTNDLIVFGIISVIIFILFLYFYYPILAYIADEEQAKQSGFNTTLFRYTLIVILSLFVTAALKIIGGLLLGAAMVIPVIAAMNITNSYKKTLIYSILFSEMSFIVGLLLSIKLDISPTGIIIIFECLVALITLLYSKIKGV